jgi:hypothetical protein
MKLMKMNTYLPANGTPLAFASHQTWCVPDRNKIRSFFLIPIQECVLRLYLFLPFSETYHLTNINNIGEGKTFITIRCNEIAYVSYKPNCNISVVLFRRRADYYAVQFTNQPN